MSKYLNIKTLTFLLIGIIIGLVVLTVRVCTKTQPQAVPVTEQTESAAQAAPQP